MICFEPMMFPNTEELWEFKYQGSIFISVYNQFHLIKILLSLIMVTWHTFLQTSNITMLCLMVRVTPGILDSLAKRETP